jgi:hypothetical protein
MTQQEIAFHPVFPTPGSDEAKVLEAIKGFPRGLTTGELIRACFVACATKAVTRLRRHGWPIVSKPIEGSRQYLYYLEAQ